MTTTSRSKSPAASPLPQRLRQLASHSFVNISLVFWATLVILPMIWLVYSSFKTDQEIFFEPWALPATLQWDNFERAWVSAYIGRYFVNSLSGDPEPGIDAGALVNDRLHSGPLQIPG